LIFQINIDEFEKILLKLIENGELGGKEIKIMELLDVGQILIFVKALS
jgi:hypothetical protein